MKAKTRKNKNISGKAPCDICSCLMYLDEHHIEGRKIKNAESPSNKIDICPNCHRLIHMGDVVIEKWVQTSSGKELLYHYKEEDSFTGTDAKVHLIQASKKGTSAK